MAALPRKRKFLGPPGADRGTLILTRVLGNTSFGDPYIILSVMVVLAECPVAVLVAVTLSGKIPPEDGVGGVAVPPQPAIRNRTINPANTRARRNRAILLFFLPNANPAMPSTGNKAA